MLKYVIGFLQLYYLECVCKYTVTPPNSILDQIIWEKILSFVAFFS